MIGIFPFIYSFYKETCNELIHPTRWFAKFSRHPRSCWCSAPDGMIGFHISPYHFFNVIFDGWAVEIISAKINDKPLKIRQNRLKSVLLPGGPEVLLHRMLKKIQKTIFGYKLQLHEERNLYSELGDHWFLKDSAPLWVRIGSRCSAFIPWVPEG